MWVNHRARVLYVLTIANPRIKSLNVLVMIGSEVSVLVTTATKHFNYTHMREKEVLPKNM
jgi:hypothetical protein